MVEPVSFFLCSIEKTSDFHLYYDYDSKQQLAEPPGTHTHTHIHPVIYPNIFILSINALEPRWWSIGVAVEVVIPSAFGGFGVSEWIYFKLTRAALFFVQLFLTEMFNFDARRRLLNPSLPSWWRAFNRREIARSGSSHNQLCQACEDTHLSVPTVMLRGSL